MNGQISKEALPFLEAVFERKVRDVVALNVSELTSVADVFIIGSGNSTRQVKSMAEHVRKSLSKMGKKPFSMDGEKEGDWVLLDYGDVVIHLFYEPTRRFYDLEGLWLDAERICKDYIKEKEADSSLLDDDDDGDDFWSGEEDDYEEL